MMLLIIHIFFAFSSLALMLAALVGRLRKPSGDYGRLAQGSAVAFAGLVSTGTALVIISHSPILGACLQGLLYLGGLSAMYLVYRKLAVTRD